MAETGPGYLERLLDILELIADSDTALSTAAVADRAGVPTSSAFRLTNLLVGRGLLSKVDGGLVPGPQLVHLSLRTITRLRDGDLLTAITDELAAEVGESASAGLLIGEQIVLVARREPDQPLRIVARVGDIVAPHTSAMGKAILANVSNDQRHAILQRAAGPEAAVELDAALADELAEVRRVGFAVDEQTYAVGQRCRAVPLLGAAGVATGGLSVAGPAVRFGVEEADRAALRLLTAAAQIAGSAGRRPA